MSKAPAALIAAELKTVLSGILKAGDYRTDIGLSVHRGFYAHVIGARMTIFPAVIIHPGTEQTVSVRGGGKNSTILVSIPVVAAVEVGFTEDAYDEMPACTADIRRAIYRARDQFTIIAGDDALEVGVAEPELSSDSKFVLVALTVSMKIQENYQS